MGRVRSTSVVAGIDTRSTAADDRFPRDALQTRAIELAAVLAPLPLDQRLLRMRREVLGSIVFTTSFGLEDQLILHALRQHPLDVEIVTLDTGRLFPQTHDVWMESERRYGIRIRSVYPQTAAVEALVAAQGVNGFFHSRDARVACCHVRKVEPLNRALAGAAAWITGIRAAQSEARRDVALVNVDWDRGILKFNPLFDWTREAVLNFTREHDVPVNALHAQGFASIGCAPCTRAVAPGENERAGRWWWEEDGKKECGLHERGRGRAVLETVQDTAQAR
jgi:phosphoadenosine phosphosulfate reductase